MIRAVVATVTLVGGATETEEETQALMIPPRLSLRAAASAVDSVQMMEWPGLQNAAFHRTWGTDVGRQVTCEKMAKVEVICL